MQIKLIIDLHEENPRRFYIITTFLITKMFVYKHVETIDYVKNKLLFQKNTNFTGK